MESRRQRLIRRVERLEALAAARKIPPKDYRLREEEFTWNPWEKYKDHPPMTPLPILGPPCPRCQHWQPQIVIQGGEPSLSCCVRHLRKPISPDILSDFSCFEARSPKKGE